MRHGGWRRARDWAPGRYRKALLFVVVRAGALKRCHGYVSLVTCPSSGAADCLQVTFDECPPSDVPFMIQLHSQSRAAASSQLLVTFRSSVMGPSTSHLLFVYHHRELSL